MVYTYNGTLLSHEKEGNPNICMEPQKIPNSQSKPEKEEKSGGITLPDFKLYDKAIEKKRNKSKKGYSNQNSMVLA